MTASFLCNRLLRLNLLLNLRIPLPHLLHLKLFCLLLDLDDGLIAQVVWHEQIESGLCYVAAGDEIASSLVQSELEPVFRRTCVAMDCHLFDSIVRQYECTESHVIEYDSILKEAKFASQYAILQDLMELRLNWVESDELFLCSIDVLAKLLTVDWLISFDWDWHVCIVHVICVPDK